MSTPARITIGVVLGVLLSAVVLANLGAMAGGSYVLRVADHRAMAACCWVVGGGVFLCTLAVMIYRTGPPGANASSRRPRRSLAMTIFLRLVVAVFLVCPLWSVVGVGILRRQVMVFAVEGDGQLLEAKRAEAEQADRGFRLRRLGPPGAEEYTLFVRNSLAESLTRELKAEGIRVHAAGGD